MAPIVMGLNVRITVTSFPTLYVLIRHFATHNSSEMLDSCCICIIFTIIHGGCFLLSPKWLVQCTGNHEDRGTNEHQIRWLT